MKLKKGDTVIITAGKDRGKKGKVENVCAAEGNVLLPGLNVYKRHIKKKDDRHPGGIIEFSRPMPVGNVALLCPACSKSTRVGYLVVKDEKYRVCKKCGGKV